MSELAGEAPLGLPESAEMSTPMSLDVPLHDVVEFSEPVTEGVIFREED